jgi:hypothetical protein
VPVIAQRAGADPGDDAAVAAYLGQLPDIPVDVPPGRLESQVGERLPDKPVHVYDSGAHLGTSHAGEGEQVVDEVTRTIG